MIDKSLGSDPILYGSFYELKFICCFSKKFQLATLKL